MKDESNYSNRIRTMAGTALITIGSFGTAALILDGTYKSFTKGEEHDKVSLESRLENFEGSLDNLRLVTYGVGVTLLGLGMHSRRK